MKNITNEYKRVIELKDDRNLWYLVDWDGKLKSSKPSMHPSMGELIKHFEILYEPIRNEDDILIPTYIYIPVTNDLIEIKEMHEAASNVKKYIFDYPLTVFLMISCIAPSLVHLLNIMFFNAVPLKLCTSLLTVIPKVGDLRLPTNFKGISM